MTIQLEQQPIDRRIGQELMRILPKGWQGIELTAERRPEGLDSATYRTSLRARHGEAGVAFVSEELEDALRGLFLLHDRRKTRMKLARYIVDHGEKGWKLVSEFEYEP
jgi:hypothetical protein